MSDIYVKLQELGITLPAPPAAGGIYSPSIKFDGNLIYTSGFIPHIGGVAKYEGKLGHVSIEEGQAAARDCVLNALATLHRDVGDLNRIRFVKMLCFVASQEDFYAQPTVANGASQLILDIFGNEKGLPARSAIGVNVLPLNVSVEIEFLCEFL